MKSQTYKFEPPPGAKNVTHALWQLDNKGRLQFFVALIFLSAAVVLRGQETEAAHSFRFGFSSALMPAVNENDAKAAMKVWAETIVKEGTVRGDPNVVFCENLASLENALTNHTVDGVAMSTADFLELRGRVKFNRFVIAPTAGDIFEEYLLLVHKNSGITNLEALRGRALLIQHHSKMCLATAWLDTLLLERKLGPAQDFFTGICTQATVNKTVLPVFFGKAETCVVTRKTFQTMCELNPQLGQQLQVLATSPAFVTGAFFFRAGYPLREQDEFVSELTSVRKTSSGKQVLTVFQADGMEERPASVFDSAIALAEKRRQLLASVNSPPSLANGPMPNEARRTAE